MLCHQTPAWQKLNHVTLLLDSIHSEYPCSTYMGKDWERQLQGLPWAGSGKTTNLEVNGPNSLDSLLKIVLVYLYVHAVSVSYVFTLCVQLMPPYTSDHPYFSPLSMFSPALPASPLMFSCCPHWFNVHDRHNRKSYNVGNVDISTMVFFPFILTAPRVSTGIMDLYGRVEERTWAHGKDCERMAHALL